MLKEQDISLLKTKTYKLQILIYIFWEVGLTAAGSFHTAPAASKGRCPQATLPQNKGVLSADKSWNFFSVQETIL